MKKRHVICLAVIIAFAAFSLVALKSALTPYVTFAQAKAMKGTVQVRGVLTGDKVAVSDDGRMVKFPLRDEAGDEVLVVYRGAKPDGLEQATSVVAVGRHQGGQFAAEKLLVKCPSKYQGSVKK